jgi:hypothetical protein
MPGVILGVVFINALVGFVQEGRASAALAALARAVATEVTVLREGERRRMDAVGLVPGDVVWLAAGDKVPADLRLLHGKELRLVEAALTGESVPTDKHPAQVMAVDTPLADRRNMAYTGTHVAAGQAHGLVIATGDATETGRIAGLIAATPDLTTPLTRKMAVFAQRLLDRHPGIRGPHLRHRRGPGRVGLRHVHGGGGPGGGRHSRGPAGGPDHHPGHRRGAHGQSAGPSSASCRRWRPWAAPR